MPRSVRKLYLTLPGLALAGAGIAGYLTYTHYNTGALVCAVGSCTTVQESEYSVIRGIPIALFGLLMYLGVALLALLRAIGWRGVPTDRITLVSWSVLLAGVLYAGYLTYVEIWVIDAICQWCVASAIVTTIAFGVESVIAWRSLGLDSPAAV